MKSVVCLGRYGDVANALPIAYELQRTTGFKPKFFISEEFASILEGVSYVQPMVWKLNYTRVKLAVERLPGAIVCQSYKHPDTRRHTDSYQREAWRLAGWLDKFQTIPLVFDQRNPQREEILAQKHGVGPDTILVAGSSVSSPFSWDLWREMTGIQGIVNLSQVQAERIFDIVGLIERAKLLVTVDSAPLHFSRATPTKVIALVNEGWYGSCNQENVVSRIPYSQATPERIGDAMVKALCG